MSETEFINRIAALESRVEGLEALLRQSSGPKSGMLNIKEAAEYLKFEIPTLRKLIREKAIPFYRPGKLFFFDINELDAWLRANPNGQDSRTRKRQDSPKE